MDLFGECFMMLSGGSGVLICSLPRVVGHVEALSSDEEERDAVISTDPTVVQV